MKGMKRIQEKGAIADIQARVTKQAERALEREGIYEQLKRECPPDEVVKCKVCGSEDAVREYGVDKEQLEIVNRIICDACDRGRRNDRVRNGLDRLWAGCDIPEALKAMTLQNYEVKNDGQQTALSAAHVFADEWRHRWLCFVGKPGTGKGHMCGGIVNKVFHDMLYYDQVENRAIGYMKHIRLIRRIRACYSKKGASEEEVINELDRPQLLILDEVGLRESMSDWERATLDDLIDYRYEHRKALIITSNLPPKELFGMLGDRVRSRFAERGQIVPFTWEDWRKASRKD